MCCMQHSHDNTRHDRDCPLCRQTVVLGKAFDQDQLAAASLATFDLSPLVFDFLPVQSQVRGCFCEVSEFSSQWPSTLLGLHCALIG